LLAEATAEATNHREKRDGAISEILTGVLLFLSLHKVDSTVSVL